MLAFIKGLKSKFCAMLWTILGLEALVVIYLLTPPPIEPMIIIEDTFVSIKGDNYMVESSGKASYTVSVNKNLEMDLNVTIAYGGVAKHGVDFSGPTMVVIKEGELSANFDVVGLNDNLKEGSETFTVKIANVTGKTFLDEFKPHDRAGVVYTKIEDEKVPVRVNSDTAELTLTCDDKLTENAHSSTCQMHLSQKALEEINIVLDYSGSSEFGVDYNATKNIQIKKGETTTTFNVDGLDDYVRESNETILIKVASVDDVAFEDIRTNSATATIIVHDETESKQPIELFFSGDKEVIEGQESSYTLTLSERALEDVTVYLDHSENTDDFTVVDKVIIAKGEKEKTFSTASIDDNTKGNNGFIVYTIAKVEQDGFEKVTYSNATVKTKLKDETVPVEPDAETAYIALKTGSSKSGYLEDDQSIQIKAVLSQPAQKDMLVKLDYSGQATLGKDFSASNELVIKKGQTEGTLSIVLSDDNIVEGAESLVVAVSSHGNGGLEDVRAKESLNLLLDDEEPAQAEDTQTATVSLDCPSSLFENKQTKHCKVTLSQTALEDVVVTLAYGGSATYGIDFNASKEVVIKKGERSANVTVTSIDDVVKEGKEEIIITLQDVKQTLFEDIRLSKRTQTLTLRDEKKPTQAVTLTLGTDKTVVEGDKLTYTLSLSQAALKDIDVAMAHSTNVSDFNAVDKVTIPKGQQHVTFVVETNDDNVVEKNDFIVYSITKVEQQGFEKLVPDTKPLKTKIIDEKSPEQVDDETAYITLSAEQTSFLEDAKAITITASLSQKAEKDLKITLQYSGEAKEGTDYRSSKSVRIKKGDTKATFTLTPINDNLVEGEEKIVIDVTKHGDAGLEDLRVKEVISLHMKDESVAEAPTKLSAKVSLTCPKNIAENDKVATCQVKLSQNPVEDVVVMLGYSGSAEYGVDYESEKSVTIKKGTRSANIQVTSLNDALKEGSEEIVITLVSVKQKLFEDVRLQKVPQTVFLNDEKSPAAVSLTLTGAKSVVEGQPSQYTLTLSQKALKDVQVTLTHNNSTDFKGVDGVSIPTGEQSVSFAVDTIDDNVVEKGDVIVYSIAKVKQQGFEKLVANKKRVTTNITDEDVPTKADDDTAYLTLHTDSESISEDVEKVKVTARLSQTAKRNLTLTVAYSGQSVQGKDFKANEKIIIKKGAKEGYTYVYPINDNVIEGSESLVVEVVKHNNGGLEDVRVKGKLTANIVDEKESSHSPKASVMLTGPSNVSEPDLSKPYSVKIDQKTADDMVVTLAYSGSADSSDYKAVKQVTVPKGSDVATFTVQTLDDTLTEDLETFTVSIASVKGGGLENIVVLPNVVTTKLSDELDIAKEFERIVSDQVIEFDSGSREINAESKKPLDKIAALLKRYTKAKIVIQGHTNSVGNAAYNKRLSQDRAVSIRVYLVSKGVRKNRIKAIGYGSTRPLLAEGHPEALEVNRRVEFKVVY